MVGENSSGRSGGRVARSGRNVRQPNQVIGDEIAGYEVKRRPGAGEERRATTKHDGAEVESILIDKTGLGQALRQDWSANLNLASLQAAQASCGRRSHRGTGSIRRQVLPYCKSPFNVLQNSLSRRRAEVRLNTISEAHGRWDINQRSVSQCRNSN